MPESLSIAKGIAATIGLIAKLTTRLHSLRSIVEGCDSLLRSLSILGEVLKHVQSTFGDSLVSMNSSPTDDATLLKKCVQNCHNKCSQLQRCLESIQFSPVPRFKALKEEKNIDGLKRDIESEKSTLAILMSSIAERSRRSSETGLIAPAVLQITIHPIVVLPSAELSGKHKPRLPGQESVLSSVDAANDFFHLEI